MLPALNEQEGIGVTINEIKASLSGYQIPRFLVIDGHSRDKTVEVAKGLGAEVVMQTGKGKGNAIECALSHLNNSSIDYVILLDADHTYPAQYIPQMIELLNSDLKIGMVCGNRLNSNHQYVSGGYMFYLGNKVLAFLHSLLNGVNLNDPLTGLRVIRWSALKDWKPKSKSFDIEVELNHHVERQKYLIKEIEISYRERLGTKKLKIRHGLVILKRIFHEALDIQFFKMNRGRNL